MNPIMIAMAGAESQAERLAALSSPAVLLSLLAVALFCSAASAAARRLDHLRIRQAVCLAGGEVLQITYIGLFDEWHGRTYEVAYRMAGNVVILATCKTALAIGVLWVSSAPPRTPLRPAAQGALP